MALAATLLAAACDPISLTVGAGATVGLAGAQERGLKGSATDARIYTTIVGLWLQKDFDLYRAIDLSVVEGRALLTGKVRDADTRVEAVRLAWQA
ncbi:MAG: phospholipid-binding domain-containing protein, partial [Alphaproteobacteria bacterium]|nr:phospholipid-binding domain-containing protein [Alphaproteobacteria bacterium]